MPGNTVLIVEDRMHMRKIVRSILNGMGIKMVQESHDGRDARVRILDRKTQR